MKAYATENQITAREGVSPSIAQGAPSQGMPNHSPEPFRLFPSPSCPNRVQRQGGKSYCKGCLSGKPCVLYPERGFCHEVLFESIAIAHEAKRGKRGISISSLWEHRKNFSSRIWFWKQAVLMSVRRRIASAFPSPYQRKDRVRRERRRRYQRRAEQKNRPHTHITPGMIYLIAKRRRTIGIVRAWRHRRNIASAVFKIISIEVNYRLLLRDLDMAEFG